MDFEIPEGSELFLDGNRGIYIPQQFAAQVERALVSGVSDEDWADLEAGPEGETYWDTWDMVLNNAVITGASGTEYTLYQDGDLWVIPNNTEEGEDS